MLTEQQKSRLSEIHPTLDFSESQLYEDNLISFKCEKHGEQRYSLKSMLYRGRGCPLCLDSQGLGYRRTALGLSTQLNNLNPDPNIDWSKTRIVNGRKVELHCVVHGTTITSFQNAKAGNYCRACVKEKKYDVSSNRAAKAFVTKAVKKHGDKYDYTKTEYRGALNPITITCKQHGDFILARAGMHTQKHPTGGCPYCTGVYTCPEDYERKLKSIHGDNIVVTGFIDSRHKANASCKTCGHKWRVRPRNLTEGHGCPICSRVVMTDLNTPGSGTLYLLKFTLPTQREVFKVGVTNLEVEVRVKGIGVITRGTTYSIEEQLFYEKGTEAYMQEQEILEFMTSHLYRGPKFTRNGHTEMFAVDPRLVLPAEINPFIKR